MTERTSYEPGIPNWVDLGTSDLEGAKEYYTRLFGWELISQGEEFGGYSIAHLQGKAVGGIGPVMSEQQPVAWGITIATDDIAETAAKVTKAGGTLLGEPMDVGTMGRLVAAQDPAGAVVAFWEKIDFSGSELVNEPGTFVWADLLVSDTAAADTFYAALFDYDIKEEHGSAMYYVGEWIGASRSRAKEGTPPHWQVYFAVESLEAALPLATSGGGSVVEEPIDSPYGRHATVRDPWGATFKLIQSPAEQ